MSVLLTQMFSHDLAKSCFAGIGFQMPGMTTTTHAATPGLNDDVTYFCPGAVFSFNNLVIPDDTTADASAEGKEYQTLGTPPCPGPELSIGGGVGIVLES